ncbi:hypothetical protein PSCICE_03130 [Pseudomonas cichorii]|nr:hypothetical protein PSCICE_03130 [Pseudomonas cichorii]
MIWTAGLSSMVVSLIHMNTEGRYRRILTEFTETREQKNNIHDYSLFDVDEITRVLKS